jgi:hypothetical protein
LQPLDHIQTGDALLTPDGQAVEWPGATVIVGNPPFLGTKKQWKELGVPYTESLRSIYSESVPGFADLVCYWFSKAHRAVSSGKAVVAGLVGTNSIRGGLNRKVLDRIAKDCEIFDAWDELPWINEGAAVKVSLVTFARKGHGQQVHLNGQPATAINADLTTGANLSVANALVENVGCCYCGTVKAGPFDVDGDKARAWLRMPNVNGKTNAAVVRRWANGLDVLRRDQDNWLVDFGCDLPDTEAQLFDGPYRHVREHVRPLRMQNNRESYRKYWWLFAEPVPKMRAAVASLSRQLVTVSVAKHRIFTWLDKRVLADHVLLVIAREDDFTFGVLQSRFHKLWSLRLGTSLEDRPRYTPTTCFETFPFPKGLTPRDTSHQQSEIHEHFLIPAGLQTPLRAKAAAVAAAASRLHGLREQWLNPPEWTRRVRDVVPLGMSESPYPDRVLPRDDLDPVDEKALERRTLTNLYNEAPQWLQDAHEALDRSVATAYGWDYSPAMTDEELLSRLLFENATRQATRRRSANSQH